MKLHGPCHPCPVLWCLILWTTQPDMQWSGWTLHKLPAHAWGSINIDNVDRLVKSGFGISVCSGSIQYQSSELPYALMMDTSPNPAVAHCYLWLGQIPARCGKPAGPANGFGFRRSHPIVLAKEVTIATMLWHAVDHLLPSCPINIWWPWACVEIVCSCCWCLLLQSICGPGICHFSQSEI